MVALAMGELCAPPTAVGGAALHKHRSLDEVKPLPLAWAMAIAIGQWSLQEEEGEEEEEEEPLEKRKLIYIYRKTVRKL